MKYTIKKLAELADISTRTLRYYDQIGLLKPSEKNNNNYRIYNEKNVNKLQQIMFYRALGFPLKKIKQLMDDPNFSEITALREQQQLLLAKEKMINLLLTNIDETIKSYYGGNKMTDKDKFKAFKEQQITNNENEYGSEIRSQYDPKIIDKSNQKYINLSESDFKKMNQLEAEMIKNLLDLKHADKFDEQLASKIYQEHKEWLEFTWPNYTKAAHRSLADLYINDDRFGSYYNDKAKENVVKLLHDVIYQFTE